MSLLFLPLLQVESNTNSAGIYNYHAFALVGIFFELIGALFVSMEAIGVYKLERPFKLIKKVSAWALKSWWRMLLLTTPILTLVTISIITKNGFLTSIMLPLLIFIGAFPYLLDYHEQAKKWITTRTKERRIGPVGFIILAFGAMLQMISIIWQMAITY